jgi:hypothetical protein
MSLKDSDIVTTPVSSRRNFLSRAARVTLTALGAATTSTLASAAEKKRDASDYVARDNKGGKTRDKDKSSGDRVGG